MPVAVLAQGALQAVLTTAPEQELLYPGLRLAGGAVGNPLQVLAARQSEYIQSPAEFEGIGM